MSLEITADMSNDDIKERFKALHNIEVVEDINCEEPSRQANRYHECKLWHIRDRAKRPRNKRNFMYADRINKKWGKRWGFRITPLIVKTDTGYICHPKRALRLHMYLVYGSVVDFDLKHGAHVK